MTESLLMRDETLFRRPELFDPTFLPDDRSEILHRGSQIDGLAFALRPAALGQGRPVNSLLVGSVATGKTTVVRTLFKELEEESTRLVPVYVNCQVNATRYLVASHMFKALFGHMPPHSGYSFQKLFERVARRLAEEKKSMVVALDDIQYLFREKEVDAVLNALLRAHEVQEGAVVGVVAIYSGERLDYPFDAPVASVFVPEEILFPRYTRDQVRDILGMRVKEGFFPGALPDGVLERVVDVTTDAGDLRVGIDLLRRSALRAESQARRKVEVADVEDAFTKSRALRTSSLLQGLRKEEKVLLRLIAENEARAGDLQKRFQAETGLGYTSFHDTLKRLESLDLVQVGFTGKGTKGRSRLPRLSSKLSKDEVLRVLSPA
ncbi:MAG: ORC1-type DNA replication protein [Halobacteria archaeon]